MVTKIRPSDTTMVTVYSTPTAPHIQDHCPSAPAPCEARIGPRSAIAIDQEQSWSPCFGDRFDGMPASDSSRCPHLTNTCASATISQSCAPVSIWRCVFRLRRQRRAGCGSGWSRQSPRYVRRLSTRLRCQVLIGSGRQGRKAVQRVVCRHQHIVPSRLVLRLMMIEIDSSRVGHSGSTLGKQLRTYGLGRVRQSIRNSPACRAYVAEDSPTTHLDRGRVGACLFREACRQDVPIRMFD